MMETVQAALDPGAITAAAATTRLSGLVMGLNDLAREMGARQTPERTAFLPALAMTVIAARAHGLVVLDSVHNAIDDLGALEQVCRQGADFGFDGKSLIHPSHIDICNRVYSPDAMELAWAREVIAAFAAPENAGKGALRVSGRLAEALHRDQARRLVAIAEAIAAAQTAA
jgi:citrate lyase subunit beta/citryl-CoA lyase